MASPTPCPTYATNSTPTASAASGDQHDQGLSDAPHGSPRAPLRLPAHDVHVPRRPAARDRRCGARPLGLALPVRTRSADYGARVVAGSVAAARLPLALVAVHRRTDRRRGPLLPHG